jgi:hypothetical protein
VPESVKKCRHIENGQVSEQKLRDTSGLIFQTPQYFLENEKKSQNIVYKHTKLNKSDSIRSIFSYFIGYKVLG